MSVQRENEGRMDSHWDTPPKPLAPAPPKAGASFVSLGLLDSPRADSSRARHSGGSGQLRGRMVACPEAGHVMSLGLSELVNSREKTLGEGDG